MPTANNRGHLSCLSLPLEPHRLSLSRVRRRPLTLKRLLPPLGFVAGTGGHEGRPVGILDPLRPPAPEVSELEDPAEDREDERAAKLDEGERHRVGGGDAVGPQEEDQDTFPRAEPREGDRPAEHSGVARRAGRGPDPPPAALRRHCRRRGGALLHPAWRHVILAILGGVFEFRNFWRRRAEAVAEADGSPLAATGPRRPGRRGQALGRGAAAPHLGEG